MKKARTWIDSDFGDDANDDFASVSQSYLKQSGKKTGKSIRDNFSSWTVKHAPTSSSSLAVHFKKVEEVKSWLVRSMSDVSLTCPILLLRGPAGAGKTATIRALAQELGIQIQEWEGHREVTSYQSKAFVGDQQYQYDEVPYVSQAKAFENFMCRANKYNVLSILSNSYAGNKKLVLLDSAPSFASRDPAEFHRILSAFRSKSAKFPLIIVYTENETKKNVASKTLFPDQILANLKIETIQFNPINTTNMVKALKTIATSESHSSQYVMPDNQTISALAESTNGDIRGAVNALQFACLKGQNNRVSSFSGTSGMSGGKSGSSARKKKKLNQSSATETGEYAQIGGKDQYLDLFHGIGKVLYAKRQDACEPFFCPKEILKRKHLQNNPEEILNSVPMSEDSFACFLHQSYSDFFTKVEDLAQAADCLSLADPFFNEWTTSGKVSLSEYGGIVAVRGILFSNTCVAKQTGMRTFHKPDWYQNARLTRQRSESVSDFFQEASLPNCELTTVYAPTLANFFPNLISAQLSEWLRFRSVPNIPMFKVPFLPIEKTREVTNKEEEDGDPAEDFLIEDD